MQCYNCNQIGHYKNKCPEAAKAGKGKFIGLEPSSSRPTAVVKGKTMMEGTLLIQNIPVRLLFDTGASHSFISQYLIDRLCIEPIYLVTSLRVANPIGEYATLGIRCDQLELDLLGLQFACSLYVYDFIDFEIILGIDRLSNYEARMFC